MNLVYLSLGSNTGNSREILTNAIILISNKIGKVVSLSSLYETEAWGNKNQAPFLNQVLSVETKLSAEDTLKTTLEIEKAMGRVRIEKWGPRTLDIDLLYFNQDIIVKKDLKIPHPELHNRKFVLVPLQEVDPDFIHPVYNLSNKEMLNRCEEDLWVKKIEA